MECVAKHMEDALYNKQCHLTLILTDNQTNEGWFASSVVKIES